MKTADQKIVGIFQYFYHCAGEELPIRDIIKRHKTEPHYENLTENWCGECMNNRIRSANRLRVDYLFLMTRYFRKGHPKNGKLLVVGFLYRAKDSAWRKLNKSRRRGAAAYDPQNPQGCGFFVGDETRSHIVSANNAYELRAKNGRWKYFAREKEAERIISRLRKHKNILGALRRRVKILKSRNYENGQKPCRGCKQ